jgi:hypothetical protein
MKIKVFWDIMPYYLASSNRLQGLAIHLSEDGGRKFLRNVGTYLPVDEATYSRRLEASLLCSGNSCVLHHA